MELLAPGWGGLRVLGLWGLWGAASLLLLCLSLMKESVGFGISPL